MKPVKRKTAIKCPHCKKVIIGHKYPGTSETFNFPLVKHNENTSRKPINHRDWNYDIYCLSCESEIRFDLLEMKRSRNL